MEERFRYELREKIWICESSHFQMYFCAKFFQINDLISEWFHRFCDQLLRDMAEELKSSESNNIQAEISWLVFHQVIIEFLLVD